MALEKVTIYVSRCKRVRNRELHDWECLVKYNYSEFNLGLKNRVSSGLDWVFEQVDRAIILKTLHSA